MSYLLPRGLSRGFTLIEILIAIGILLIISVISLAALRLFEPQARVDTSAQRIVNTLQLARNNTLASEDSSVYGVHFDASAEEFILFKGSTFTSGDSNNKIYDLEGVDLYQVNLAGGGNEVIFDRVRGSTNHNGDVRIRLSTDTSKVKIININPLGQSSISETLTPVDSRIKDTRHLHFDLGWSIQNAVTLRLVFSDPPNPNVTRDIAMASFFDVGKTEFDWEDETVVGVSPQLLRIHTHLLNSTDTTLSIHRDARYNNKAVQIFIHDSSIFKDIVTYTDVGVATVGSFGGTMTQQ